MDIDDLEALAVVDRTGRGTWKWCQLIHYDNGHTLVIKFKHIQILIWKLGFFGYPFDISEIFLEQLNTLCTLGSSYDNNFNKLAKIYTAMDSEDSKKERDPAVFHNKTTNK